MKLKYDLFIQILSDILESEKPAIEKDIKNKYGEKKYRQFSKLCLGIGNPYVIRVYEKNKPPTLELTKEGLRFYLNMNKNNEERIMGRLNLQASLGVSFFIILSFFFDKFYPKNDLLFQKITFWITVLILLSFGIFLIFQAFSDFFSLRR